MEGSFLRQVINLPTFVFTGLLGQDNWRSQFVMWSHITTYLKDHLILWVETPNGTLPAYIDEILGFL